MKTKLFFVGAIVINTLCCLQKANAQNWLLNGNSNATNSSKLGTLNNIPLRIYTNSLERIHIDNTGNVGIGTSSPIYKLDINTGSSGLGINIAGTNPMITISSTSLSTANNGSDLYLRAKEPGSGTPGNLILQDNAVDNFNHYLGGSVGIGTNNPWYGGNSAKVVQLSATNFPQYLLQATGASTDNQVWRMIARNSNIFQIQTLDNSYANEQTAFQINRNGNSITTVSFPSGNIGIGTANPLQKLHVAGASVLANNTTINPSTTTNAVVAGAIHDGSGWAVTSGIGGKASGAGQEWGIGYIGNSLYFGLGDGTTDNTMQTGMQIFGNTNGSRTVLLVPGGSGNVGIGVIAPAYKLDVCGTIRAKELRVETGWCDYVFGKDYKLKSIDELEKYISDNKHLPGIASAAEVDKDGLKVAEMSKAMMEKIEELSLYVIQLSKQNQNLQKQIDALNAKQ